MALSTADNLHVPNKSSIQRQWLSEYQPTIKKEKDDPFNIGLVIIKHIKDFIFT